MQIDNEAYDRLGRTWWDEANPLNVLHGSITPGRFEYFRDVLRRLGCDPRGWRVLDIGCGGGFLAEEFARLRCRVMGVAPSTTSIETAQRHARQEGLDIEYLVGVGEELPVDDSEFDLAYCCDVLEHVSDLDRVASESARAIKPGGIYLFDTINRTLASKLLAIKIAQEWRPTRVIDTPIHVWEMFIKPPELTAVLARHGLHIGEIVGLGLRAKAPMVVLNLIRAKAGRITYGELSRRLDAGQVKNTQISYMGFARKAFKV